MDNSTLVIRGAREHNLRNVDLDIPRNQLVVFTGVSGSGKSSLAFDTLYAEGQRRYVESLSAYARQFLGQLQKPDVDYLAGLSPAISIQQKAAGKNPRSTVGTITEIHDYLRVLFARVGQGHCPICDRPITAQSREQILQRVLSLPEGTEFLVLAPVVRGQKGEYKDLFQDMLRRGFLRARVDGQIVRLTEELKLDRRIKHHIEIVIDRLRISPAASLRGRLAEAIEQALLLGEGNLIIAGVKDEGGRMRDEKESDSSLILPPSSFPDMLLSAHYACTHCEKSYEPPSPQMFSFNSPHGMCPVCDGLGMSYSFDPDLLIPDTSLSFYDGAVPLIGPMRGMGRWRKHIYEGLAATLEIDLKTPWHDLPAEHRQWLLHGTGDRHITYVWKQRGGGVWKHGGTWEGIVPQLLSSFKKTAAGPRRLQLEKYMRVLHCATCNGQRLNPQARAVRVGGKTLVELCAMPLGDLAKWLGQDASLTPSATKENGNIRPAKGKKARIARRASEGSSDDNRLARRASEGSSDDNRLARRASEGSTNDNPQANLEDRLEPVQRIIAVELLKEIRGRVSFLLNVGLHYLTLDRAAPSLSGGETQRIRLAGQIGSGLTGVLYVLDEPSIGLHPRDNDRLLASLQRLRDLGNTVLVVEHDEDTMRAADFLVDFGPGPGVRGGEVIAAGSFADVVGNERSLTGQYLSGALEIPVPKHRRPPKSEKITIRGARHHNLKNIDVDIPLGLFVCVTGVSGSGKSSLINDILKDGLKDKLGGGLPLSDEDSPPDDDARAKRQAAVTHDDITGWQQVDKVIDIDQSPIGRTPRSNPATYIKVFDQIRDLYAQMAEAKVRGYLPGRFSFNKPGGRCEACEGNGSNRLEMDFLADVWVTCPVCDGRRFNRETLQIRFKDKNIRDVLEMDIDEALEHFANIPKIRDMLKTLKDVGLDYLKLGQPSPTLSGGEAQRIKLARELCRRSTGKTLYVLDEPTTGLHFADIHKLLEVLHGFVGAGNTVVVIEHNLDVIKTADWLVDLGPEGGAEGGEIVCAGTPEDIAACGRSYTGQALKEKGRKGQGRRGEIPDSSILVPHSSLSSASKENEERRTRNEELGMASRLPLTVVGAQQHNLKNVSVTLPREKMTVCCGPSGSGKSSLALDTIFAEGQRRYVESLSAYARQFLGQMQKPKVESVSGLSPAISIEQQTTSKSPRSTVGTVTEIYDYLRILYARLGQPYCPACAIPIGTQTSDEIIDKIHNLPEGTKLYLLAPIERRGQERYDAIFDEIRRSGFVRVRIDGRSHNVNELPDIDHRRKHAVEVVVDRNIVRHSQRSRLADAVETALDLGRGVMLVAHVDDAREEPAWKVDRYSQHYACDRCGRSFEPLNPHHFSFNSPLGWCPVCEGIGTQKGANPTLLVRDPSRSLRQGALAAWPDLSDRLANGHPFLPFAEAIAQHGGFSLDTRFEKLDSAQQRILFHGSGDAWIPLSVPGVSDEKSSKRPATGKSARSRRSSATTQPPALTTHFQYKGVMPALDEASRISFVYRQRLDSLVSDVPCGKCQGSRLRDDAAACRFAGHTLGEVGDWSLDKTLTFFNDLKLSKEHRQVAGEVLREIRNRLKFLVDVGLDYLSLSRSTPTLSGGESQRIRLASQIGSGLTGVLYVLDEPTIGLHPRDNRRLLTALENLRNLGNTLILVEHDREVINAADYLLDFGPGAGNNGGEITAQGTPKQILRSKTSLTGDYLSGRKAISVPTPRRGDSDLSLSVARTDKSRSMTVKGARQNNLKNLDVAFPLGRLIAVTGVSGSGKSSLVHEILYSALARKLHRARVAVGAHDDILGLELVDKVINVDQDPIGNSPNSNPATYTGVFDLIRELFAKLPESRMRGYRPKRFSFNVAGGRCEACEGNGQKKIEMHFLPDVWVPCDVCQGSRFTPETLAVRYRGKNIADVLSMQVHEALTLLGNVPKIRRVLQTLVDVGLGYLSLGQAAPTLSGGEAQRVKLAAELARPNTGKTVYILDEPTTGLHFDDIGKLLGVLNRLVDLGNTVIVVEHNLDVIKTADWVIDLGPEGGTGGGRIAAEGTPEDVAQHKESHTGTFLAPVLAAGPIKTRGGEEEARRKGDTSMDENSNSSFLVPHSSLSAPPKENEERRTRNEELGIAAPPSSAPWEIDGRLWHTQQRMSHKGTPCRWDGEIVSWIEEKVHSLGKFAETNWRQPTVVEIAGPQKSLGWFCHIHTGMEWLVRLVFRVGRNAFAQEALDEKLAIPTLNNTPGVEVYSSEPRVHVANRKGPWQEVWILVHRLSEIQTPAFETFLRQAVSSFHQQLQRIQSTPEDVMPWKVNGERWHLSDKGFPPGKKLQWDRGLLPRLLDIVRTVEPGVEIQWDNRAAITFRISGMTRAWAQWRTKDADALVCRFQGKKGQFNLSQLEGFGIEPQLQDQRGDEVTTLRFQNEDHLPERRFKEWLTEHLRGARE